MVPLSAVFSPQIAVDWLITHTNSRWNPRKSLCYCASASSMKINSKLKNQTINLVIEQVYPSTASIHPPLTSRHEQIGIFRKLIELNASMSLGTIHCPIVKIEIIIFQLNYCSTARSVNPECKNEKVWVVNRSRIITESTFFSSSFSLSLPLHFSICWNVK